METVLPSNISEKTRTTASLDRSSNILIVFLLMTGVLSFGIVAFYGGVGGGAESTAAYTPQVEEARYIYTYTPPDHDESSIQNLSVNAGLNNISLELQHNFHVLSYEAEQLYVADPTASPIITLRPNKPADLDSTQPKLEIYAGDPTAKLGLELYSMEGLEIPHVTHPKANIDFQVYKKADQSIGSEVAIKRFYLAAIHPEISFVIDTPVIVAPAPEDKQSDHTYTIPDTSILDHLIFVADTASIIDNESSDIAGVSNGQGEDTELIQAGPRPIYRYLDGTYNSSDDLQRLEYAIPMTIRGEKHYSPLYIDTAVQHYKMRYQFEAARYLEVILPAENDPADHKHHIYVLTPDSLPEINPPIQGEVYDR